MKLLNITELAPKLGVTVATARLYVNKGMPHADQNGKLHLFSLNQCVEWKAQNIKPDYKRPPGERETSKSSQTDKETQEVRLKTAQADLAELKYQEQLGRLVSADDALKLFQSEILVMKSKLEQMPIKIAASVYSENNQKKCQSIIEREVMEALNSLSSHYKTAKQLSRELVKAKDLKEGYAE